MKKAICILVTLILSVAFCIPVNAENVTSKYAEKLTGAWEYVWRYIPTESLSNISDLSKPVNLFVFPETLNKAGMKVVPELVGNDSGEVFLILNTSGNTHGELRFEGCYIGKISFSEDGNTLLVAGLHGGIMLYHRLSKKKTAALEKYIIK